MVKILGLRFTPLKLIFILKNNLKHINIVFSNI